ncbi:helix-turn-helix domain-containing protein [Tumebacillus flagellatus]|uniref:HTH cro/C1-type domain-containing protein n=1 Tax=Tumebacillus flagellatus TaxID=1157490 RepID=A0A074LNI5_9BACL|nr:helix-turn-helix transcriptional regulator [Tumebacillus flagellatus]KEO81418.1 hypothetical protein EL26_21020 [Tumebacillus flagellatus]
MKVTQTLGQKIRICRLQKGLTQSGLAEGIITPSMVSQIESDKANPSHEVLKKIAARLEVPLEDLMKNATMNLNYTSRFQIARALVENEQFSSALRMLHEITEECNAKVEPFEVSYHIIFCMLQLDMLEEAKQRLDLLSSKARVHLGKNLHLKLHYLNGVYEMRRHRYQIAEYHFMQALADTDTTSLSEQKLLATTQMELGNAQQRMGKLKESLETLQSLAETLLHLNCLEDLGDLYLQMSQTCLHSEQLEESIEYAELAILYTEQAQNKHRQVMTKLKVAVIQASTGQAREAEQIVRQIADEFLHMKKPEDAGVAFAELSKIQVERSKLDQAYESSQRAKDLLPQNHEHYALALRVQAKIAQARHQTDFASKLFKKSADCYKLVGSYNEYEQTMQELSAHYARTNDSLKAYETISEMLTYNLKTRESRGIVL